MTIYFYHLLTIFHPPPLPFPSIPCLPNSQLNQHVEGFMEQKGVKPTVTTQGIVKCSIFRSKSPQLSLSVFKKSLLYIFALEKQVNPFLRIIFTMAIPNKLFPEYCIYIYKIWSSVLPYILPYILPINRCRTFRLKISIKYSDAVIIGL